MTVCIAAICRMNDGPKIVICSDRRIGSALGTSEISKQGDLRPGWVFLFADEVDSARTMLPLLKRYFAEHSGGIDETNIIPVVQLAVMERKQQLANQHMVGTLGETYDWFIDHGKDKLSPVEYSNLMREIKFLTLGAHFIIAGFIDNAATIVEIDNNGQTLIVENYSVIGEGRLLAKSVLLHRSQTGDAELERTLYNVFEAKKYAERIASVGPETDLTVFGQYYTRRNVTQGALNALNKRYAEYGPKDVPNKIDLGTDILETTNVITFPDRA